MHIKNHNPQKPKIKSNIKISGKQSLKPNQTKAVPNLQSKIEINEDVILLIKLKKHSD